MKWNILAIGVLIGIVLSCGKTLEFKYPKEAEFLSKPFAAYPQTSFAVMTDLHFYDKSLGVTGTAYSNYLLEDRKLLTFSEELLAAAVGKVAGMPAEFVIICGDLTKDGEKVCHEKVAASLALIEASGKKVFVVPGNHDINNPHAVKFDGETKTPVESIDGEMFARMYGEFGFNEAIERDTNSLSYLAEPVPGLWLLCLDSTDHDENYKKGEPVTPGRFTQATIDWMEKLLHLAVVKDKAVIAVMHHGVVEHWTGQSRLHPEYLIDNYKEIAKMFAAYHVRTVFTGHYHANDIALNSMENGEFVFDIETGSLVTYPCPVRTVAVGANQKMEIETLYIDTIPGFDGDLKAYSKQYVSIGLEHIIHGKLKAFFVDEKEASIIAPLVVEGYLMHYAGEDTNTAYLAKVDGLSLWGGIVFENQKYVIEGVRVDLEPPDNKVVLDLTVGAWSLIGD
ncbi:MAG: hypothetical protein A2Y33_15615 [Spirochaetes bacterium GWF1_51_8]|nr:MAG: hypothetical protein A2Y33_15615 [Spirochaetes bacterium GWF1_51_8]